MKAVKEIRKQVLMISNCLFAEDYGAIPENLDSILEQSEEITDATPNKTLSEIRNKWQQHMLEVTPEMQAIYHDCIKDLQQAMERSE